MKKYQISLWLIAIIVNYSYGQYGGRQYPHANSFIKSAKATSISPGFVMGGIFPLATGTGADFLIEKTDVDGLFTGPDDFTEYYTIQGESSCAGLPYNHKCVGVDVIETNPGGGVSYAVAGAFDDGIFFVTLSSTGAVLGVPRFWPFSTGFFLERPTIRESASNPGDYYICGNDGNESIIIKVDFNGAILWANLYQNVSLVARGLVESPYNVNELIVIGRAQPTAFLAHEGFFLSLDATNGSVNTYICYSDPTYSGDEYFASIEIASSTVGGSQGYIIGGHHVNQNVHLSGYNTWMIKLDPAGTPIWSSLINHSEPVLDVFERYNPIATPTRFEYFGLSRSWTIGGNKELTVWKLNELGASTFIPSVFKYDLNAPAAVDLSHPQLDFIGDGTVAGDGFAAFGTDVSVSDNVLIKSYYNGVNGCENLSDMAVVNGPGISTLPTFPSVVPISDCFNILINSTTNTIPVNANCAPWVLTDPMGSNAKTALATALKNNSSQDEAVTVFPNPSSGLFNIEVSNVSGPIQIKVLSTMGQLIHAIEFKETQNETGKIILNFEELKVSEGLYFICIIVNNQTQTKKIVYSK